MRYSNIIASAIICAILWILAAADDPSFTSSELSPPPLSQDTIQDRSYVFLDGYNPYTPYYVPYDPKSLLFYDAKPSGVPTKKKKRPKVKPTCRKRKARIHKLIFRKIDNNERETRSAPYAKYRRTPPYYSPPGPLRKPVYYRPRTTTAAPRRKYIYPGMYTYHYHEYIDDPKKAQLMQIYREKAMKKQQFEEYLRKQQQTSYNSIVHRSQNITQSTAYPTATSNVEDGNGRRNVSIVNAIPARRYTYNEIGKDGEKVMIVTPSPTSPWIPYVTPTSDFKPSPQIVFYDFDPVAKQTGRETV